MKPRMNSLYVRGLLLLAVLSLLGVALIGSATYYVSRSLLADTFRQSPGQDAPTPGSAAYAETITLPAVRAAALVSGAGIVIAALGIAGWALSTRGVLNRTRLLQRHLVRIEHGDLSQPIPVFGHDELSALAHSLNRSVGALRESSAGIETVEAQAAERSKALEQRLRIYQAVGRITSVASALRDVQEMLYAVVTLVSDSLGIDRVGLFVVDEATRRPILSAASSEGARDTLIRHQMLRPDQDLVGRVAATGQPQMARDVDSGTVPPGVPELPPARIELALPLKVHDRVTGVLDLQSARADTLTQDDVPALLLLADQIALAIENARLVGEEREVAEAFRRRYGEKVAQDWAQTTGPTVRAYRFSGLGVIPLEAGRGEEAPPQCAEIAERPDGMRELRAPLVAGDQVLGFVSFHQPILAQPWGQEDLALVAAVCGQVGQALERARLLDEARDRDEWRRRREALTEHISLSATHVDHVLETTIRELGAELGASGTIRLRALSDWRAGTDASDAPLPDMEPADV